MEMYLTTGFLHGCKVSEQESNPLIESLLNRSEWEPYPDAFASLFFSWYVYTLPAVEFRAWRVILYV